MAEKKTFTVQFSEDETLYYVAEMAFKHAWLSVVKSPEVPSAPRLVMPYSGVCAYERVGEKYFRVFYNQSYFSVRLGPSEAFDASEDLVRDYADAAAFIPLEDKSMQKGSGKTKAGKRKS